MSHSSSDDPALPILRAGNFLGRAILAINPKHAFNATDHSAHRAADDRTDRAGTPITFIYTMRNSARHALACAATGTAVTAIARLAINIPATARAAVRRHRVRGKAIV
jgi:hypothetical protein